MAEHTTLFSPEVNQLGESPLWDHRTGRLYWVDSRNQSIKVAAGPDEPVTAWRYEKPVGSIGLAANGLVAAFSDGFALIDGTSGAATPLADIAPPGQGFRLNDGKADRAGRFIAGHMNPAGGDTGEIWSVDAKGNRQRIETGVGLSNGLCFSPDGSIMYFTDSMTGILRRYAYNAATGQLGARDDFLDYRPYGSPADGATVDKDGCIWAALILAHKLVRFAPDGTFLEERESPVKFPSCPAFGGADFDQLFVTTISNSGGKIINTDADAGRIVAFHGLAVPGIPEGILSA